MTEVSKKMVELLPGIEISVSLIPYVQWRGLLHDLKPVLVGFVLDSSSGTCLVGDNYSHGYLAEDER